MNPFLYQNVVFRLFDRARGRRNMERLRFLRQSQFWPRETLDAWRLERLNRLLLQARDHSPFHRERLASVKLPLRSLEELQSLPILTKDQIRRHKDAIRCGNVPDALLEPGKTGGSTGEPMHYYYDKRAMDWNRGTVYRSQEWSGTFLGERTVQMMGSHYDHTERQKLKWRVILWLQRYKDMPVAVLSDEILDRYVDELQRWRPTNVWGYASGVHALARFVEKNRPGLRWDFLKAFITSSETLFPNMREDINRVFGGPKVFDHYGSREMYIASECRERRGYHMHAETVVTEVVDKDGRWKKPGEMGRVLVTELFNHGFPFVRYEIGDVGVMSEQGDCPCGVKLPRLAKVEGRISDVVVLKDRVLTSPNFTILFSDFEGLDAYQVVQKSAEEIDINLVKNDRFTAAVQNYIQDSLSKLLGPQTRFRIRFVPSIAVPASGKRRFVVSDIAKDRL